MSTGATNGEGHPKLLYAVIREDPRLEGDLIYRVQAKRVLCVASGGCVALSLASRFPQVAVTAFDTNAAQLAHMKAKAEATLRRDLGALNVENAASAGLNQCGDFERVFRLLRAFFEEFIASHHELLAFFIRARSLPELDAMVRRWTTSRYWRAAFHACFEEVLVETTLGKPPRWAQNGTHQGYFQKAFERGFRRDAAPENPFLQHVFLGGYRRECAPHYIRHGGRLDVTPVHGTLLEVPELERFDVVSLGNLLDGMEDAEIATWARALKQALAPGSALLIRQMNSTQKLRPFFEPEFRFDDHIGRSYALRDRSLLYNRFEVGFRTAI
ncbi:MAG: DUF3419 family protein [Polyangiaceae bacterium]|jgi:S-adenosylmethionine-diacylglycerol 3-amino-3-carboxypropyl transferase|nr:DUF3419 family protein [Polyangiaceae bacterium]MBK8938690.1 DUF3419 family protein [Polyangiaceae bacterium]